MKKLLLFGAAALLTAHLASASVIIALASGPTLITSGPNTGNYNWVYSVTLSNDQNFRGAGSTDFTEIIDFGNLVASSFVDAADDPGFGPLASIQQTGPGNPPPGITDSPSISNVVFRNAGATVLGSSVTGAVGDLGMWTLVSASNVLSPSVSFSTQAQKVSDLTTTFNQGYLPNAAVPEPMTLSLMGTGLLAVGLFGRRRLQDQKVNANR